MARSIKSSISTNSEYMSNGVTIIPAMPSAGETVKISYDGLLAKSGATDVLARVGFGNNWDMLYDYRMYRSGTGFEANIPVSDANVMNVCFKDCANNWDNNSGRNYIFDVS